MEKSWNCVFEFLWMSILQVDQCCYLSQPSKHGKYSRGAVTYLYFKANTNIYFDMHLRGLVKNN